MGFETGLVRCRRLGRSRKEQKGALKGLGRPGKMQKVPYSIKD